MFRLNVGVNTNFNENVDSHEYYLSTKLITIARSRKLNILQLSEILTETGRGVLQAVVRSILFEKCSFTSNCAEGYL